MSGESLETCSPNNIDNESHLTAFLHASAVYLGLNPDTVKLHVISQLTRPHNPAHYQQEV